MCREQQLYEIDFASGHLEGSGGAHQIDDAVGSPAGWSQDFPLQRSQRAETDDASAQNLGVSGVALKIHSASPPMDLGPCFTRRCFAN